MHMESTSLVLYGPVADVEAVVQQSEYRLPQAGGHHHRLHGSGDMEDWIVVGCRVVNLWVCMHHRIGVESHA